jgi:TRAP-type C4-dicarboxylate transport system substrate-binding protein
MKEKIVFKIVSAILLSLLLSILGYSKTYQIKFATQAPEGSAWINFMKEYSDEVKKLTNAEVFFKIYAGGIQGDEIGVLRKIRINSLQSAGFTGVGAGEILPEFRIIESPMLLRNYEEVDFITNMFYDYFAEKFEEKGFILLGLTEVGFVYVFAKKPITSLSDFKGVKMWMWEGDPLVEATFKSLKANAIPLSIADVLTSLQTNLIEGVYTSPLACVSLQWHTRINYMMDVPLTNSFGAILISKKMYDSMPPEYQKILVEKGREYMAKLVQVSRADNDKSIDLIEKNGVKLVKVPQENLSEFYVACTEARQDLVGKLYSAELLNRIETALSKFRNEKAISQ